MASSLKRIELMLRFWCLVGLLLVLTLSRVQADDLHHHQQHAPLETQTNTQAMAEVKVSLSHDHHQNSATKCSQSHCSLCLSLINSEDMSSKLANPNCGISKIFGQSFAVSQRYYRISRPPQL